MTEREFQLQREDWIVLLIDVRDYLYGHYMTDPHAAELVERIDTRLEREGGEA